MQTESKDFDIYHFMPFAVDKDYCKEIRRYISIVPNDDDWICIWDGDTCRTMSNWGETISRAIETNLEYDLLTGTATRVGGGPGNLQKMFGEVSYQRDMIKLHKACRLHETLHSDLKAIPSKRNIVGFLFMFRKRLAMEFPFESNMRRGGVLDWDTNWCQKIRDAGKNVGVIRGISIYHHYRLHKKRSDDTHLK